MMLHTGQLQSFKGSGNIVLPGTLLLDQPHFELVMMQYLRSVKTVEFQYRQYVLHSKNLCCNV